MRPPCWPEGQSCPNPCAGDLHRRLVDNHVDLTGPWAGWRLRGRDLVSPAGDRITPERMRGLMFRHQAEDRLAVARARRATREQSRQLVRVVVVDLATYLQDGLTAS